jgi:hypothetical protein
MSNHNVRNSIGSLAELARQAPQISEMLSVVVGQRRRRRTVRIATNAAWLGAGLAAGAGLMMLLSPSTGAQVRRRIVDQAQRVRRYVAPKSNGAAHVELS